MTRRFCTKPWICGRVPATFVARTGHRPAERVDNPWISAGTLIHRLTTLDDLATTTPPLLNNNLLEAEKEFTEETLHHLFMGVAHEDVRLISLIRRKRLFQDSRSAAYDEVLRPVVARSSDLRWRVGRCQ